MLSLPIEVIRKICEYLSPKSCVALMLSCRGLMFHLNRDRILWKSICDQLNIQLPEENFEGVNEGWLFFPSFRWFIHTRDRLITHDTSVRHANSSRLYYNIRFEKQGNQNNESRVVCPKTKVKPKIPEDLITHSTIVYDYDESYFVVIQTKDRSEFWERYNRQNSNTSIPRYSRATVYSLVDGVCTYIGFSDLPFEVAAQDIKVYNGFLFLLPIKDPNIDGDPSEVLIIYSILKHSVDDVLKYKSSYCLQPTTTCPERYRISPNVYKESGEKRIYILNNRNPSSAFIDLLAVLPVGQLDINLDQNGTIWTILVVRLQVLSGVISLIKEVPLPSACFDVMGQVFSADQKNSTLALALYASSSKCKKRYKSLISIVDIHPTSYGKPGESETFNKALITNPWIEVHGEDRLPSIINNGFNLKGRVQDMKLYYLSATNYYHTFENGCIIHENARKSSKSHGFYAPILVFLLASDRIVLYSAHVPNGNCLNLQLLFGAKNRFLSKNWHHSELQVQDKVPFKSTKTFHTI